MRIASSSKCGYGREHISSMVQKISSTVFMMFLEGTPLTVLYNFRL